MHSPASIAGFRNRFWDGGEYKVCSHKHAMSVASQILSQLLSVFGHQESRVSREHGKTALSGAEFVS